MKESNVDLQSGNSQKEAQPKEFNGYSLEELKYQKALLLLRKEYAKEKFLKDLNQLKSRMPGGENAKHASALTSGLFGKIAKSLNYMDYIVLGLSLFSTGRKVLSVFRKTKK